MLALGYLEITTMEVHLQNLRFVCFSADHHFNIQKLMASKKWGFKRKLSVLYDKYNRVSIM